jgi:DNA invertase Pin-like site-specific DNA recombinase
MTVYGYARVSSADQDLSIQKAALAAAGCAMVRSEKVSGTTTTGRDELRLLLDFIQAGDVLMVTRIDRLARSIGDLQDIVRALKAKGAALKATEQPIDTSTAAGKAFLDMLGVFAEFETNLRRERQLEGIAKAKAEGKYKGRPVSIDPAEIARLKAEGLGSSAIADRLGIARSSVYRVAGDNAHYVESYDPLGTHAEKHWTVAKGEDAITLVKTIIADGKIARVRLPLGADAKLLQELEDLGAQRL